MKNMELADIILAEALGMSKSEVKELDLHQSRILLQREAFKMRDNGTTITQSEADKMNKTLRTIQWELEEMGEYDGSIDYIVDFDSFVVENPQYNRFCW